MAKYKIFFLSDHTAITVEKLGNSLLTQFADLEFERILIPYINSKELAEQTRDRIDAVFQQHQQQPIVVSSIVNKEFRGILQQAQCVYFDFFETFIPVMEQSLGQSASWAQGRAHALLNQSVYEARIEAIEFSLKNDDGGISRQYDQADVIVVGVSRSGKTPTCLYLAMQFGVYAANYPLDEEELTSLKLPKVLQACQRKIFGLTIEESQLHMIRNRRLPDSRYASLKQCRSEISAAEQLFQFQRLPYINTTAISVEEIATTIMAKMKLLRRIT